MNLKQLIKRERAEMPKKIPKLLRIKIGKALFIFASLPLCSAWAFLIAIPMMIPVTPSLWAKDKFRYYSEGRKLK